MGEMYGRGVQNWINRSVLWAPGGQFWAQ